ncbi:MAG: alpha/beta hydrolase [candidate division WS1 bacterium]|nr:alpha/beta hydrolase [candidate division WS1 bacterium]
MPDPESRRSELYSLLGDLPSRDRPISAETVAVEECEDYVLEKLVLDLNGLELAPAYFVRPHEVSGPTPTILYNHAHGGTYDGGKEEFVYGRSALRKPAWATLIARQGWCGMCIDTWAFGERRGRTESEIFKQMLWYGQVMWGMMVYDSIRAVDYLSSRPEVDPARLGTMGISMGSTMSWWLAALDPRIKVCVDICCLTDFHALIEAHGLDGHGIYYYVPSLLKHFTTAQINTLIAPRAHLSLAGDYDCLTPVAGLERIDAELQEVYAQAGVPEAWKLIHYKCGHLETAAMRAAALDWLQKWL